MEGGRCQFGYRIRLGPRTTACSALHPAPRLPTTHLTTHHPPPRLLPTPPPHHLRTTPPPPTHTRTHNHSHHTHTTHLPPTPAHTHTHAPTLPHIRVLQHRHAFYDLLCLFFYLVCMVGFCTAETLTDDATRWNEKTYCDDAMYSSALPDDNTFSPISNAITMPAPRTDAYRCGLCFTAVWNAF